MKEVIEIAKVTIHQSPQIHTYKKQKKKKGKKNNP